MDIKNMRKQNLLKNSGASILLKLSNIFMKFLLRTVFIYYLGKEYTGVSTLFTDILQVLSLFDLGVTNAMIFSLYKPMAEGDKHKVSALMNFYKKAYFTIGTAILIAGFAITPFLNYIVNGAPNIQEDIRVIFLFYVISTTASYFLVYRQSLLVADQKARIVFIIDTLVVIIEGIIEVVLIMIFRSFMLYLIIHLISVIARNVIVSQIATKQYKDLLNYTDEKLTKRDTKVMFNNVYSLGIYKVSGVLINSADSIIISAFVGTSELAILGTYKLIINSIRQMVESIAEASKPTIGNLSVYATAKEQRKVFEKIDFISYWIALFTGVCLFVLLDHFVTKIWMNSSFQLGVQTIIILVINYYIGIMVLPVEIFRTGNGLFVQGKYRPAIMATLNIVLNLVFVQYWGIFGILLATFLSRVTTQVWFDALLIYKLIFRKSVIEYYKIYIVRFMIFVFTATTSYFIANIFNISNVFVDFLFKLFITVIISNLVMILIYRKDERFLYLKTTLLNIFKNKK